MATTKDELWSLGQRSRALREFLSVLLALWNDSAAHEISTRYLVPLSDDDQRMQRALDDQQSALEELQGYVATVMELASAAEGLSRKIAQLLCETLQEVSTANGYYQSFSEFNNAANNLFPVIKELISQANTSCFDVSEIKKHIEENKSWTSPSGLIYESVNRLNHVLSHVREVPPGKKKHGVFSSSYGPERKPGNQREALSTIDKAWRMRENSDVVVRKRGSRIVYSVPMGEIVGYHDGDEGANQGYPAARWVIIVVEAKRPRIVTAFPAVNPQQ